MNMLSRMTKEIYLMEKFIFQNNPKFINDVLLEKISLEHVLENVNKDRNPESGIGDRATGNGYLHY